MRTRTVKDAKNGGETLPVAQVTVRSRFNPPQPDEDVEQISNLKTKTHHFDNLKHFMGGTRDEI